MLASPFAQAENDPPKEGGTSLGISGKPCDCSNKPLNLGGSDEMPTALPDEYAQLQMRILMVTFCLSAIAVVITAIFFDLQTTTSLLVGAFLGLLYFRLLARSVSKLGKSSKQVSKIQLLIPVLLVLVTAKLPGLDLIPALLGFLLYKPSLILQTFLETRS